MIDESVVVSKRNKEWVKKQAMSIAANSSVKDSDYRLLSTYWKYYNNEPDDKKHDFLRKMGENIELPVYYYHIPLQRILLDNLISQQAKKNLNISISVADKDSMRDKYEEQMKMYVNTAVTNAEKKIELMNKMTQQIQQQIQQLEQQLQQGQQQIQQAQEQGQEPDTELLKQVQMLTQQLPLIKQQAEMQLKQIQKQTIITNDEMEQIRKYQITSWKDQKEIIAEKTLIRLKQELKIESKSVQGLKSRLVTGKERFFVYYDGRTNLPQFEVLDVMNVSYPIVEGVDDISKGKWVKIRERMSVHHVLNNWGKDIESAYGVKAINDLQVSGNFNTADGSFISTPMNAAIFIDELDSKFADNTGVIVDKIYFKVSRKQTIKYSPNINGADGDVFRHFIDNSKELIKKEDFTYKTITDENGVRKSYYINKKNKDYVLDASTVEIYSEQKSESYAEKYTSDRYEAIIIADKYIVGLKRSEYICRNTDKHSDINLPVFGRTYSSITDQPYSLIGATIDLQDLYDVIHMEEQLMISLAGTKGNIIDMSQKPTSMSREEWEYNWKMGRGYIQTKDANGNNISNGFNQWQNYDNTLSPSIQYLTGIKEQIRNTMGDVIGVGRQRQGKVDPSDQVATFEMALQQNELVTEIIYYDHDLDLALALTELLHLTLRYCYINNDIIDIPSKEIGSELFVIPAGLVSSTWFRLNVFNNAKQEKVLKDIRSIILQSWKAGQTPMGQLVDAMIEDSVGELRAKVRYWEEKASEINSQNREATKQDQIEIEKAKAQFKAEFEQDWRQQELKIKEMLGQVEVQKFQLDSSIQQRNLDIIAKANEDSNKLKLLELMNEDKSESGVLMENKEARINSQKLESLQIQLNAMMQGLNLSIQKDSNDKKHVHDMEKVKVDKEKKIVKEHINDN